MGLLGKLIASPVRLVNLPLRAAEDALAHVTGDPPERILSEPLEQAAELTERLTDDAAEYLKGD